MEGTVSIFGVGSCTQVSVSLSLSCSNDQPTHRRGYDEAFEESVVGVGRRLPRSALASQGRKSGDEVREGLERLDDEGTA